MPDSDLDPADAPDSELLEAARGGQREALGLLLQRHGGRIFRSCGRMCAHPEDVHDVYQETLLTITRHIERFRGDAMFLTWAYAIARSCASRHRRRSKYAPDRQESLETLLAADLWAMADPKALPEQAILDHELRAALIDGLGALSSVDRQVLLLRDIEGWTSAEVGRRLELTIPAVKTKLHRSRVALRSYLRARLGLPEVAPGPDDEAEQALTGT
jgi:RNA polymerase sigma-70 factor (ECF subfamily)